jgi:tetratricopeptide (TPR) repeat protein
MERQRVSSTTRLNQFSEGSRDQASRGSRDQASPAARRRGQPAQRLGWGAGALGVLLLALGCSTPLDKGRTAWADGQGNWDVAEPHYKEAVDRKNAESEVASEELYEIYMQLAAANKKGKPKKAEAQYRAALELQPTSAEARTGLIRLLMTLYRYDEAFTLANEGATSGKCPGCKRLLAVMLIEGGDQRSEAGDWPGAEASYAAAMDLLPDASVALGLTRARIGQKKAVEAVESLKQAAAMIDQNDQQGRQRFLDLRKDLVTIALEAGKPELADEVLDVAPKGVSSTEQLGLMIDTSMQLTAVGKADEALARMQALAVAASEGKLALNEEQKAELLVRVALVFGARANQRLANGDAAGASADLDEALKLVPGEPTITLQKALVFATQGDLKGARELMATLPRKTAGFRQADAIVFALDAEKALAAGKLAAAAEAVSYGKLADASLPEIRIAAAQVLLASPLETDMLKKEARELRSLSLVEYPKNKPVRAGEALAELAFARTAHDTQDKLFPFRDPGRLARLDAALAKAKEVYPLPVSHVPEPKAVLVFKNTGAGELELLAEGHRFFRKKKKLAAGESGEIEMPKPGLLVLTTTAGETEQKAMFIAEPNTKVEISLPFPTGK